MKRRLFLSLLGGAAIAPGLPAISAPSSVAYSRTVFGQAVFHARTRAHVSAKGIAFRLKVPVAQAEAMIGEMASKGMVTPVVGKPGAVRAVSNILKPGVWRAPKEHGSTQSNVADKDLRHTDRHSAPDLPPFVQHLRKMCQAEGMILHPRCFA